MSTNRTDAQERVDRLLFKAERYDTGNDDDDGDSLFEERDSPIVHIEALDSSEKACRQIREILGVRNDLPASDLPGCVEAAEVANKANAAEVERLRKLVEAAYKEGFYDASDMYNYKSAEENWKASETFTTLGRSEASQTTSGGGDA